MILFCLSHAGGSVSFYSKLKKCLDNSIRIVPIELKGRGIRYKETHYKSLEYLIKDVINIIKYDIEKSEYAIYGHSLGALIAFELYHELDRLKYNKPIHIFFSGSKSPNEIDYRDDFINLSDNEFIRFIESIGGINEKFIKNKRALDILIPILKNDFKLLCDYKYKHKNNKIECGVSILNGDTDILTTTDINSWTNLCSSNISNYKFNGDHFFVNNNIDEITSIIKQTLLPNKNYKEDNYEEYI